MCVPVIETQVRQVDVVINKGFYLFFRTVRKKDVRQALLFYGPALAVDDFRYAYLRIVCFYTMFCKIFV